IVRLAVDLKTRANQVQLLASRSHPLGLVEQDEGRVAHADLVVGPAEEIPSLRVLRRERDIVFERRTRLRVAPALRRARAVIEVAERQLPRGKLGIARNDS